MTKVIYEVPCPLYSCPCGELHEPVTLNYHVLEKRLLFAQYFCPVKRRWTIRSQAELEIELKEGS